jgi:hypothetical protein
MSLAVKILFAVAIILLVAVGAVSYWLYSSLTTAHDHQKAG